MNMAAIESFPRLIRLDGDQPFRDSIQARRMALQCCSQCHRFRYPVAPVCPYCFSDAAQWQPVSGRAELLSWAVFHRRYLPAYPPPHNVIVARLTEGPSMVSNLVGAMPEEGCIGRAILLDYIEDAAGVVLPVFRYSTV